jgi:RNase P/RNase MRP subunit p30
MRRADVHDEKERRKKNAFNGGVVLSSGSRQATELRAPHDVANLACLFGMRDENARAAMSARAFRLVRRARRKRARERHAAGDK